MHCLIHWCVAFDVTIWQMHMLLFFSFKTCSQMVFIILGTIFINLFIFNLFYFVILTIYVHLSKGIYYFKPINDAFFIFIFSFYCIALALCLCSAQ